MFRIPRKFYVSGNKSLVPHQETIRHFISLILTFNTHTPSKNSLSSSANLSAFFETLSFTPLDHHGSVLCNLQFTGSSRLTRCNFSSSQVRANHLPGTLLMRPVFTACHEIQQEHSYSLTVCIALGQVGASGVGTGWHTVVSDARHLFEGRQ